MIRTLFLLLLIVSSLLSNSKETCFTVQLLSKMNVSTIDGFHSSDYPDGCKAMIIGKAFTVRCGCYNDKSLAQSHLNKLRIDFSQARVVTTYKYRFKENSPQLISEKSEKPLRKETKKRRRALLQKEEELKLILQVFLYKGDLESAYKVANLGYKRHPNSYYWNQKMAEICKWTNRPARSMKHLRFMYEKKYDKKIEKELIDYGAESYQYEEIEPLVLNRMKREPTKKNIDLLIYIYKNVGEPEKVITILDQEYHKDKTNKILLTKALALSLEVGDLERAKKYVDIIEANKPYSIDRANLVANYYYIKRNIKKSYKSLFDINSLDLKGNSSAIEYYKLKSDLGWYVQDNNNAAAASLKLMELGAARVVDYERISHVYQKKSPNTAAIAAKNGYKQYKLSYLFYIYANTSLKNKKYDELKKFIDEIEKDRTSTLLNESLFWVTKANLYDHYNDMELEEKYLLKALELSPNNLSMKSNLLSFYMKINNPTKVEMLLMNITEETKVDSSFFFVMATSYLYLGDINRASYYVDKINSSNPLLSKTIEFKFLQAYIYQSKNNENAFKKIMQELEHQMKQRAKVNPKLKTEDKFLSNYLRAAIHVLDADTFRKKLKKAKKYLTKENYDDISYSFAVMHQAYEKSRKIYHRTDKKALWLIFSNNLIFNNHSEIENMLSRDLKSLAMGDASQAAYKDGQRALSQTIAYEGLLHNDDNQNAYIQHLDISQERSDKFSTKLAYDSRDPLLRKYTDIDNIAYLRDGKYFLIGLNYYLNSSLDYTQIINVPDASTDVMLGFKSVFDKGYYLLDLHHYKSMDTYYGYSLFFHYRLSTDLIANVLFAKNRDALESIPLILGANRDIASLNLVWTFLNSTSLSFSYEKYRYHSQDSIYLGKGEYKILSLNHQIRNGYPDLKAGVFYDTGKYSEQSGSKGVVDMLQKKSYAVLPEDFYSIGAMFSYGMRNSETYTRVWRPYAEISTAYSSVSKDYTYNVHLGIGGKVLHQDHLTLGVSYAESISGIGTQSYEIYLKYRFFYTHP